MYPCRVQADRGVVGCYLHSSPSPALGRAAAAVALEPVDNGGAVEGSHVQKAQVCAVHFCFLHVCFCHGQHQLPDGCTSLEQGQLHPVCGVSCWPSCCRSLWSGGNELGWQGEGTELVPLLESFRPRVQVDTKLLAACRIWRARWPCTL